jgi:formimidoylglutamate deiminase
LSEPIPSGIHAKYALLPSGWEQDVSLLWDDGGRITDCRAGVADTGLPAAAGPVVPGMINLHSHVFQRDLTGRTQQFNRADDDFWAWRAVMYDRLATLTPEALYRIAVQTYTEMLSAGYTSVCEFHYVHLDRAGQPYDDPDAMSIAILEAARKVGIGLTLLPVLYLFGGFGRRPPDASQARLVLSIEHYLLLVERLHRAAAAAEGTAIGYAPHSLRAVDESELTEMLSHRSSHAPDAPVHVHIAEQRREVEACLAYTGSRPVDWLLDHADVDDAWCLIHATHTHETELKRVAGSGAVVGLCPTTEADLGDGFFDLVAYLGLGGRFGVGSDSNVSVSPFEEIRLIEYVHRLRRQSRNIDGITAGTGAGTRRYLQALDGGRRASGRTVGALALGHQADFLVLDPSHPLLVDRSPDEQLNAMVFSGSVAMISGVHVAGKPCTVRS